MLGREERQRGPQRGEGKAYLQPLGALEQQSDAAVVGMFSAPQLTLLHLLPFHRGVEQRAQRGAILLGYMTHSGIT